MGGGGRRSVMSLETLSYSLSYIDSQSFSYVNVISGSNISSVKYCCAADITCH